MSFKYFKTGAGKKIHIIKDGENKTLCGTVVEDWRKNKLTDKPVCDMQYYGCKKCMLLHKNILDSQN